MASSLTELYKGLECDLPHFLSACICRRSTAAPTATRPLPWLSLLKSTALDTVPSVSLIPLYSLVSGPPSEVTSTLALALESTHPPNLHVFLFSFSIFKSVCLFMALERPKKARPRLAQKGHFHTGFFLHSLKWEVPWFS